MAAVAPSHSSSPMPTHSSAFRTRRFLNWFPLGLAYAFLYMARYNLTVAKTSLGSLMTKEDFGIIFAVGTWVYGVAFLLNGPVTDKIGGRRSMLISLFGSLAANLGMGIFIQQMLASPDPGQVDIRLWMSVLYGVNMYFQSFAAVAIVKVNASWFHLRERGGFSGIFGTMISSGIFFAYTVNQYVLEIFKTSDGKEQTWFVFYVPAALLGLSFLIELFLLRDEPVQAGHQNFDVGDGDSGNGEPVPVGTLLKKIFTHPVIMVIALVEFCTGVLRQGIMQWVPIYVKEVWVLPKTHWLDLGSWENISLVFIMFAVSALFFFLGSRSEGKRKATLMSSGALIALAPFLQGGWGGILFVAGVIGGNVAGYVSDLFFQSRRAPAAGGMYFVLFLCTVGMYFSLGGTTTTVGWADSKKTDLKIGDQILSVAGEKVLVDWSDISAVVASIPAKCKSIPGATETPRWDSKNNTCSSKPEVDGSSLPVSTGTISAVVMRDGKEITLDLKDPKPAMFAGDKRTLAAGPKLTLTPFVLGVLSFLMSLCVIGTHGLLSGTATMDFGGRRAAATAVGVIDGFVYLGSGLQGVALGYLTTNDWAYWPMFLAPFALVGFLLCLKIWNAKPKGG